MRILIAVTLALLMTTVAGAASKSIPVYVGGDEDEAACPNMGEVVGLNVNGDNFLAVRRGPGTKYKKFDEIHTGDEVFICGKSGKWYGIVYPDYNEDDPDTELCGVDIPWADEEEYEGDCLAGWVSSKYIDVF